MSDIDDLVDEEQDLPTIKASDQAFIQLNCRKLSLEQLCIATQLDPETITQYIEEYEGYLKDHGINPDKKFAFNIGMSADGTVSYSLEWPDIHTVDAVVPFVGKMFFLLNDGQFEQSMANFLLKYAEERGAYKVVKEILKQWNEQKKARKETPLIGPHEVFRE